jgi:hypothetical protein
MMTTTITLEVTKEGFVVWLTDGAYKRWIVDGSLILAKYYSKVVPKLHLKAQENVSPIIMPMSTPVVINVELYDELLDQLIAKRVTEKL